MQQTSSNGIDLNYLTQLRMLYVYLHSRGEVPLSIPLYSEVCNPSNEKIDCICERINAALASTKDGQILRCLLNDLEFEMLGPKYFE